jgi:hypothetical protein
MDSCDCFACEDYEEGKAHETVRRKVARKIRIIETGLNHPALNDLSTKKRRLKAADDMLALQLDARLVGSALSETKRKKSHSFILSLLPCTR